ncbi:MAG: microcystin degradation protein MlrC [Verrucomicrobiales bacterium]|jgi:microcystin degradation protein MlrC
MKIFVAGLFHETHTFVDDTTVLADFEIRRGQQLLNCEGDSSPLGGALHALSEHEIVLGPDYRAVPSGTVDDAVVESFWSDLENAWETGIQAVYLVLHGAMASKTLPDVEGEILARVRRLSGAASLPVYGVYDLHANFSAAMAEHADVLVAYRENPHTDARQAAVRAADLLQLGLPLKMNHREVGFIWAPTATGTADDPMRSLEALAREIEAENDSVHVVNVAAGFAFADTPSTGVSFQVIGIDPDSAELHLDRLVARARELENSGPIVDEPIETIFARLPLPGLTAIVEPSDNIGGGAPGDCTGLLRALIERDVANSAVCLNDPESVQQLLAGKRRIAIGGKGSRFDPGPLELEVELISTRDGRFELEDKQSHLASMSGDHFDMGPSAVVRHGAVTILLTTHKTPPFDLGQWRSQGVDPATLDVIVVKAAVAHRRAYDPIAAQSFWADTPGPCRSDLSHFPYKLANARIAAKTDV